MRSRSFSAAVMPRVMGEGGAAVMFVIGATAVSWAALEACAAAAAKAVIEGRPLACRESAAAEVVSLGV